MLPLNRAIHQCNRTWDFQVCHTLQLFELMHFPDLILIKNMDYFFQILVDQTSMLVDKIIDPILVFQTVNSVPIRYVVAVVLVLPAKSLRFTIATSRLLVITM